MGKPLELTGQKFGKLTALECLGSIKRKRFWHCRCDCGMETLVPAADLNNGHTTSCGCSRGESQTTHGMTDSPEHDAWLMLRQDKRTTFPPEWSDFTVFLEAVGMKPTNEYELSRKDRTQPHGPTNTYWRNPIEENNYRLTATLSDFGRELSAAISY